MMRAAAILSLVYCLVLTTGAFAQEEGEAPPVTYPDLAETGDDAASFVPTGWVLEKEIRGDLNKDGADDLVMVLHDTDAANLIKPDLNMDVPLDTNPRMISVAFADKAGGYRLELANSSIIPRIQYTNESDPLSEAGGVSIDRGSLVVALYYFSSSGGSDTGNVTFRFRYEKNDFRLIGYDRYNLNRMSGEIEDVSANFLNRKVIIKTGTMESDTEKSTTKRLKSASAVTIGDIDDPWVFAPEY